MSFLNPEEETEGTGLMLLVCDTAESSVALPPTPPGYGSGRGECQEQIGQWSIVKGVDRDCTQGLVCLLLSFPPHLAR